MPYVKKEDLERLLQAGQMMSNRCFNQSQLNKTPEGNSMRADYQAWDEARLALRTNKVKTNG